MKDVIRIKMKNMRGIILAFFFLYLIEIGAVVFKLTEHVNILFMIIQVTIIPCFSFIVLQLFYELFGSQQSLFLHTFYKEKAVKIYGSFILLNSFPLLLLVSLVEWRYSDFDFLAGSLLLLSQVLIVTMFSLILFAFTSDLSITITCFILYLSIEIGTLGNIRYSLHIFHLNLYEPVSFTTITPLIIVNSVLALIAYRLLKPIVS